MRVGIAIWNDRVSPVLDVAGRLLLVDVESGAEIGRQTVDLVETALAPRARRIADLGTHVLICGAISRPLEAALVAAGVQVFPRTCGPVDGVLQAYLAGRLIADDYRMPGCRGRRQRGRHGRLSTRKGFHHQE